MHLLVPFLFHALTSLYPPSFHRNDFSTCSTNFSLWGKASSKMCHGAGGCTPRPCIDAHAHVRTHGQRPFYTCMQMASFCACSRGGPRSAVEMYGWSKTIARCPCTPPSTLETLGEKSSAEACSGKEIAGLSKMMMMTRKIVKSRVSGLSRAKLEAGRNGLGLCTARD